MVNLDFLLDPLASLLSSQSSLLVLPGQTSFPIEIRTTKCHWRATLSAGLSGGRSIWARRVDGGRGLPQKQPNRKDLIQPDLNTNKLEPPGPVYLLNHLLRLRQNRSPITIFVFTQNFGNATAIPTSTPSTTGTVFVGHQLYNDHPRTATWADILPNYLELHCPPIQPGRQLMLYPYLESFAKAMPTGVPRVPQRLFGSPSSSVLSYKTVILIHGNSFSNANTIFKRLSPLNTQYNMAPGRRGFSGSAPFTQDEKLFSPKTMALKLLLPTRPRQKS
ncbi:hypothetical protein F5877DRAFT_86617 [Lentinula edodes]|nr:hypothetical protein F5877DRAFT_86617 [Lentinula edodes]